MSGMHNSKGSTRQYMDDQHLWWWEVKNTNGRIIGRSLRGYTRKVNCSTNMHRVAASLTPPIKWTQ